MDDTLLTKRRLVTMSGYFVKLFIFLYFYETKIKSINYKTQKKKNEMIIKKIRASMPLTRVLQNGDVEPKTGPDQKQFQIYMHASVVATYDVAHNRIKKKNNGLV